MQEAIGTQSLRRLSPSGRNPAVSTLFFSFSSELPIERPPKKAGREMESGEKGITVERKTAEEERGDERGKREMRRERRIKDGLRQKKGRRGLIGKREEEEG